MKNGSIFMGDVGVNNFVSLVKVNLFHRRLYSGQREAFVKNTTWQLLGGFGKLDYSWIIYPQNNGKQEFFCQIVFMKCKGCIQVKRQAL